MLHWCVLRPLVFGADNFSTEMQDLHMRRSTLALILVKIRSAEVSQTAADQERNRLLLFALG